MPSNNKIKSLDQWKGDINEVLVSDGSQDLYNGDTNGKERKKPLNLLQREPDVQNCNGQSLAITSKNFHPLKHSDIGIFMVNLTKGSMMAPHWNPRATEIAIVLQGQGMIRIVCSSNASKCQNSRLRVKQGDVFVVQRFHPMAQLSFNNGSLIFVGFSTKARRNRPQFLTGTRSVLQTLDLGILAMSFNITNSTMKQLLASQARFTFLECTSCAEEEAKRKEEEERQKKEEEEKKRKEEEARNRKEEEERKKREEEEARKKRAEEESKKREEEEARKREEERKKREEEEARKREEEARKKREEEEARKRVEEARKKREEEEEARKKREEKEERKRKGQQEREKRVESEAARRRKKEANARSREKEQQEENARMQAQQRRQRERREQGEVKRRTEGGRSRSQPQ